MKKIGLLASICMFALLMGGCTKNVESTPVEDNSETVSEIPATQNDVPEPAEEEAELSGQDAELINMGIHDDEHVMDVPNYYSSVSDADESGVYLGGAAGIYEINQSLCRTLYPAPHIAGAALYKNYIYSMEYNVTGNGMTVDLIKIKKDGSDKEVLAQISAGSYDLRIIDNILVITEQILGSYGLETVFYSYTLDDEGNLASDTPLDAYTQFDLPNGYEDGMCFLINPWFSTKYFGYFCFTKAAGVMNINSIWISGGNREALEEIVTCSGQPLLSKDTIFYCDSNEETLRQRSLDSAQETVLYEIPDDDSLSLLTYDSEWIYFLQEPTTNEHHEVNAFIMRVNLQDHQAEEVYQLRYGYYMSNLNVYGNNCYFILTDAETSQYIQWIRYNLVSGEVTTIDMDADIPEQETELLGQDAELVNMAIHDNEHNIYTGDIGNEEIRMMITRTEDSLYAEYTTRSGEGKVFHGNLANNVAGFVLNTDDGEYLNGIITETDDGFFIINGEGVLSQSNVTFTLNQESFIAMGDDMENYYDFFGYNADEAERFMQQIKDSINDKAAFAGLIQYPISIEIDGNQVMIENEESMIDIYDRLMEQNSFKQQIENIYTKYMFANYMGICIEDGIMWINMDSSGDYKITAINPPL